MTAPFSHNFEKFQALLPTSKAFRTFMGWGTLRLPFAPPQYVAMGGLTLAATEFGRQGWKVESGSGSLAQWTVFVGVSAAGKSQTIDLIEEFYRHLEPEPPIISLNEMTLAGFVAAMHRKFDNAAQRHVGLVTAHEFPALLARCNREPIIPTLHHILDGRTLERATREAQQGRQRDTMPEVILNPCVGAMVALTRNDLSRLIGTVLDHATLSRLNMVIPPQVNQNPVRGPRCQISLATEQLTIAGTCWHQMLSVSEVDSKRVVTIEPDAQRHFDENYWNVLDTRSEFFSHRSRHLDRGLKWAATYALMDMRTVITIRDISCGVGLAMLLYEASIEAHANLEIVEGVPRNVLDIIEVIDAAGAEGITRTELLRKMRKLSAKELDEAIDDAMEREKIQEQYLSRSGAGRGTREYHIC